MLLCLRFLLCMIACCMCACVYVRVFDDIVVYVLMFDVLLCMSVCCMCLRVCYCV